MKVKHARKTFALAILLIGSIISFAQCNPDDKIRKVSNDASALAKVINLNMQYAKARWEVYGFPEQSDSPLAMGPTDDIILVAELAPLDPEAFRSLSSKEVMHIKVGSARPWLRPELKTILETGELSSFDLSANSNCRPLAATLRKSNRAVNGIVCESGEKAVVVMFPFDRNVIKFRLFHYPTRTSRRIKLENLIYLVILLWTAMTRPS